MLHIMAVHSSNKSFTILITAITLCVVIFSQCVTQNEKKNAAAAGNSEFEKFAGSITCRNCHKNIYDSHIKTAHFLTSVVANAENIKGSFEPGKNTFHFAHGAYIAAEKKLNDFFQVGYINGTEKKRERIDIIFGSGTRGQTFGSWKDNQLVQLPLTYFTAADQWSNSPGYPNRLAFNRPITSRCLECHASYAGKISGEEIEPEAFDRNKMILGVDCEKCHGPARDHVKYQTAHPDEKTAKDIINPATFTRQQSLDMCVLCHGGRMQKTRPSFSFTAGDKLTDYFATDTVTKAAASIDVHGNQFGLLKASKCFLNSSTMTCLTCHNPHENKKGQAAVFSKRCMTCHNPNQSSAPSCSIKTVSDAAKSSNCAGCHMPEMPSKTISVLLDGADSLTSAKMHTHYIKVYPEETKKMLAFINDESKKHHK